MSLEVTQRPYQTINGEVSKWNAVRNPILYKFQRQDFSYSQINNNGGSVQIQFNAVDYGAFFTIGGYVYLKSDNGVYDVVAQITDTDIVIGPGDTIITIDTPYVSASTAGFCNSNNYKTGYKVEAELYDASNTLLGTLNNTMNSRGVVLCDVSTFLKNQLSPDNDADLTLTSEVYDDSNVYIGFYIKYTEVFTDSAESQTDDSENVFFAVGGAMQIPSAYGGNFYEYLILSDMKIASVTIETASVLTGNSVPVDIVAAPGAGYVIVPVKFFIFLDYNSVAYATNTTFRFEINGVAVSATNTTILPGVADRYTTMEPVDYDTTTDLKNAALKFEVQTGDPTAGNSPLKIVCLYTVKSVA